MEYPLGYSPTVKQTTVSEPKSDDRFFNLLNIVENEFNTEDKAKCLRYVFDKMIESRQVRIKEHEEMIAQCQTEIITIRRAFEKE